MTNLYSADCGNLVHARPIGSGTDIQRWSSIYKVIPTNISLVDRCNSIVMPYRFRTFDQFTMPRDLNNFAMTYEDCCIDRAQELVNHSRQLGKPITVMYSGGIDSTTVLISFMKILSAQELKERIHVALSIESIDEIGIYNTLGECVKKHHPSYSQGDGVRIDISNLPPGLYFVRIGVKVNKFVKI